LKINSSLNSKKKKNLQRIWW